MSFETELRDRLRAGVAQVEVDIDALAAGGLAVGTHRRRRRRIVGASVAAVVLVAGGTAYAIWPGDTEAPVAGTPTPTTRRLTPQDATRILGDLLPPGVRTGDPSGGWNADEQGGGPYGTLNYGADTKLVISVYRSTGADACKLPLTVLDCKPAKLSDGATLTLLQAIDPKLPGDRTWSAQLDRPDGTTVRLDQFRHSKTSTTPLLAVATMRTITSSPRWQLTIPTTG